MIDTLIIQDEIRAKLEAISEPKFRSVEIYPLARLFDEVFANDLTKLKLPACLLILQTDNQDGRNVERAVNWLVIVIFGGTQASSAKQCVQAIDAIRRDVLNQPLTDKVNLRPTSSMAMLDSGAQYTAASVTIRTVEHA